MVATEDAPKFENGGDSCCLFVHEELEGVEDRHVESEKLTALRGKRTWRHNRLSPAPFLKYLYNEWLI